MACKSVVGCNQDMSSVAIEKIWLSKAKRWNTINSVKFSSMQVNEAQKTLALSNMKRPWDDFGGYWASLENNLGRFSTTSKLLGNCAFYIIALSFSCGEFRNDLILNWLSRQVKDAWENCVLNVLHKVNQLLQIGSHHYSNAGCTTLIMMTSRSLWNLASPARR